MKKDLPKLIVIFLIVVGVVIWTLNYLFLSGKTAPRSRAAATSTVDLSFDPASTSASANQDIITTLKIKPTTDIVLRGYLANLIFDKTKLQLKKIEYKVGAASPDLADTDATLATVNQNGRAKLQAEVQTATGQIITSGSTLGITSDGNTVGLWHLEETSGTISKDASGRGHHLSGSPTRGTDGKIGKAATFVSTAWNNNTKLQDSAVSADFDIGTGFTVEAWIKKNSSTATYEHRVVGNRYSWSDANGWNLTFNTNEMIDWSVQSASVPSTNLRSTYNLALNTWYYVVGVYDSGTMRLYLNGQLNNTTTGTSYTSPNRALTISGQPDSPNYGFDGPIDEVRISNVARTAEEIRQAYESGLDTTPTPITTVSGTDLVKLTFTALNTSGTTVSLDQTKSKFYLINSDMTLSETSISTPSARFDVNGGGGTTGNVNLNLKLKFQGIGSKPADNQNSMTVKVKLQKQGESQPVEASGTFTANDQGLWSGKVGYNIASVQGNYLLLIKGPQHIQKRICDKTPSETTPGIYRCAEGKITLTAGENTLDLSGIIFLVGDLDQSGVVDSVDFSFVKNNLGKKETDILAKADLNRDGIVDTQDFSLILAALAIRTDEL